MNFEKGLERLREYFRSSNAEIEKSLGLSNGYISKIEKNPGKLLLALSENGISTDWFLTGEGKMFLPPYKGKYAFTPRIIEIREFFNLDQVQFAKELGISRSSLIDYEKGGAVPSSFISLIQEKFRVNYEWFINGKGKRFYDNEYNAIAEEKPKLKSVPVFQESDLPEGAFVVPLVDQRLSTGGGSYLPDEDEVIALVHVPAYLSRFGKNIKALTVDGDSMYPTLSRGDIVVCDSCGWSGDGIYALHMSGSGLVKRLSKKPGKLVIISDNPKYQPYEESEESQDIQIIGRVHCAIKQLE